MKTPFIRTSPTSPSELALSVPYTLNSAFRAIFKTATWNSSSKEFVVKNTPLNRKKWDQFLASIAGATEAMAIAEEAETTAEELARAAAAAKHIIEDCTERTSEAKRKGERAKAQMVELAPYVDEAQKLLAKALDESAAAQAARDLVIAPVLRIYEIHGLNKALDEMGAGASRGYLGKERCDRAQAKIFEVKQAMRKIGFFVKAIDELAVVSLNRPDKMLEGVEAVRAKYATAIKRVEPASAVL